MRYKVEITTAERRLGGFRASVTVGPVWLRHFASRKSIATREEAFLRACNSIRAIYGDKHQFTFSHVEG